MPAPAEHIAFAPFSYDCRAHGRNSASRARAPHHLFCARRLSARRALRAAQYRDPLLRAADAPRTRGADRRGRRAGGIRPVAQRAARPREELALHPVDQRRHRPICPRSLACARHSARERAGCQRRRGGGARDGADAGAGAAAAAGARQPGTPPLARHDFRSGAAGRRACRQDAADRRPRPHRLAAGGPRERFRHARHRHQTQPGRGGRRGRAGRGSGSSARAAAASGFRGADLPADPADRDPVRGRGFRGDQALGVPGQCRTRPGGRRAGADPGAAGRADCRGGARLLLGRAVAGGFTAVDVSQRAGHAA